MISTDTLTHPSLLSVRIFFAISFRTWTLTLLRNWLPSRPSPFPN